MFDVFIIADLVSLACHFLHVGLVSITRLMDW